MKIYKKERLPDGQRHIYLFGKKIISYKKRPSKFRTLFDKRFDGLTDKQVKYCIEHQFKRRFGYLPNLDDPKTFNEKLQWLKLYHRNPLMTVCADKVAVRDFVAERIGSEYLIPCLGVWDNPDDIDFDKLPDKFVLKVNWGSGQNIIVKDKSKLDLEEAKKKLAHWMQPQKNHYYYAFEWSYKDIKPKIIAEKYMEELNENLIDWKIFCNYGKPIFLFLGIDRFKDLRFNFYDTNFNQLPFKQHYKNSDKKIEKPECFDKLLELAEKLTKDFIHARADFYVVNNKIYFGEITFFHFAGLHRFDPPEWDRKLGDLLVLPKDK